MSVPETRTCDAAAGGELPAAVTTIEEFRLARAYRFGLRVVEGAADSSLSRDEPYFAHAYLFVAAAEGLQADLT